MNIVGEVTARGSAEAVWDALHDAAVLARAIPGCEHFEVSAPGLGQFIATTALPAIGGTYAGKLTIVEQQRPSLLKITASATGDQGTMIADVAVRLSDTAGAGPGGATVRYEANGTVTGPIAGVGARLLASAAKRLADEFFAGLDENAAAPASIPAADSDRPSALARPEPRPDNRTALIAGAAIGLAGVIIGVLAARRGRRRG